MEEEKEVILNERINYALSMIKENSIYFAHPVNYYMGSSLNAHENKEDELIKIISKNFPEYAVHNPNQKHHQENYQIWKKETGSGMKYYFDIILPRMSAGIGLTFEDNMLGAGVFGELEKILELGKPIYEINENGIIFPIKKMDTSRKLSIEETQGRIYGGK
jgi:hypothetical protein